MKDKIKEIENDILNYLYENKLKSPQSLAKIKLSTNLGNEKVHIKILKASLESLIEKKFIKKQEDRGNYKIEIKGIEHVEKLKNLAKARHTPKLKNIAILRDSIKNKS